MTKRKPIAAVLIAAMGICLVWGLLLAFGVRLFANAEPAENNDIKVEALSDRSEELNNGYLDRYGVPTSKFTYKNNGDAEDGAPLSYAFDRNFNSVWRSKMQTKDASTINNVTVTFNTPTKIDRIVYQADSSWYDRGYFNTLTLSYKNERNEVVACEALESPQTSEIVLVTLKAPAMVKEITLEWTKVPTNHRTVAAASEIIFLQPQSADVENVQSMFTDYAQLHLDSTKIRSKEDVAALREKVSSYASYDTELSYLLNRAEQVLDGTVYYDARREMGTSPASANLMTRHGDVAGYARNTLKFAWFGTNRQATGVSVSAGDELIVYVTGDEGDPLPSVVTSQHWGSWRSWRSGEYKLRLGKNVIKVQNYLQDGYTTNTGDALANGGPVYIVNPYTEDGQSENVKVYLEGGDLFPVFREDGDETAYKKLLADYADSVKRDREENADTKSYKVVDVTEIVSDRIIVTAEATMANEYYNERGFSPQTATKNWDTYVDGILQFDGIVLENNETKLKDVGAKYDVRNQWLNCNIRLMQPYGAAYAHVEHVGIQVSWEGTALTGGPGFGWGYTHELGHMLDIGERTVSECSNNMVSKYHETVIEKTASRGDFEKTTNALAPDDHIASYWNTNRGNFIFWWLIESYWPGYWARLENLYRYEDVFAGFTEEEKKQLGSMNATEKQVYLSSLVVGEDLSYYFERWGYNLRTDDYIFEANGANTSNAFKAVMQKAKDGGRIRTGTVRKLWYLDAAEWWKRYPEKEQSELYKGTETPLIKTVTKSADGYNLIMDVEGADSPAHLGFEIQEGSSGVWKVIGFTYDKMFLDSADRRSVTPKYRVIAYDRALQTSKESAVKSPATSAEGVCAIGTVKYGSLYEAVTAAHDGDVIILLKDTSETGIVIDKNITVRAEGAHTVTKGGPKPIFTIISQKNEDGTETGGSLTLEGADGALLTLDGGAIETNNPLILAKGGALTLKFCVLQNNILKTANGAMGGALRAEGTFLRASDTHFANNAARLGGAVFLSATGEGDVAFSDCTFSGNRAAEGGAFYNRGTVTFTGCTFGGNGADTVGGALANMQGGVATLENCTLRNNSAQRGGAIYADGRVDFCGGVLTGNMASEEGAAICYNRTSTGARPLYFKEYENKLPQIYANTCEKGAAVYLCGETALFTAEIYDNDALYALYLGGHSVKLAGGAIGGTVFKDASTPVTIENSLPEAVDGKLFVLTNSSETSVLLFTAGFPLSDGDESDFRTERGNAVLRNGNEIWLEMESYTVKLVIGDREEEFHYLPGHILLLDAYSGDYGKTTYVKEWKDEADVVYPAGEALTVGRDMTLTAVVAEKYMVRFSIGNAEADTEDIVYYVMPDENFSLPRVDPLKFVFNGWEYGGTVFAAYDTAAAQENRVYTAKLTKKLVVNYAVDKNNALTVYETRYYAFGSKPAFVTCKDTALVPSGGYINGFFSKIGDGAVSSDLIDFDTYTVQTDLTLVADVVEISVYIMYSFTEGIDFYGETVTVFAPVGSMYTISHLAVPTGYHVISYMISVDNVPYDGGGESGLEIDLTDAHFVIINAEIEKNAYNVTYQLNGEFLESRTMKYGDKLLLEDPTDTILKDAIGEGTNYSFNSFQIVTSDPAQDVMSGRTSQEMNMQIGEELVVTEDITINMLVYIEGREKAPAADPDSDDEAALALALLRLEKKQAAEEAANALIAKVSAPDFNISDNDQASFVTEINVALGAVLAEIDGQTSADGMEEALERFRKVLGEIGERADLLAAKNDAQAEIRRKADVFGAELGAMTLSEEEKANHLSALEQAVSAAQERAAQAAAKEDVEAAVGSFLQAMENIREAAQKETGIAVKVVVSGITAVNRTYDGTTDVALDLSNIVYRNAETGFEIDPAYSANFTLNITVSLSEKNAGVHIAAIEFTLGGGNGEYVLAEEGQQASVTVTIEKAKLKVTLDSDENPVFDGFVAGEDESVLSGELTVTYSEENGKRMATPGGLSAENYELLFESVLLDGGPNLGLILGIVIPVVAVAAVAVVILLVRKKKK